MSIRSFWLSMSLFVVGLAAGIPCSADSTQSRGVVIDFSASWCGPCQQMAPMVERLARQGFSIRSVDVDQRPDLKARYNITSLPTFVLIVDGKEVERRVGAMPETEVKRMLAAIPTTAPARNIASNTPTSVPYGRSPESNAAPQPQAPPASPIGRAKSALLDMLPGRTRPGADGPQSLEGAVVRANADDRVPAIPIATGPMASSVRIRVRSGSSFNFGSGTVIGSAPGRATIATCWHIFREATRDSKIEVDTFFTGRNETYVAKLVGADEKADAAIIEVSTDTEWPVCRVAPASRIPTADDPVVSIGCGGGQEPTRQSIQVTAIDKYNGPSTIECSGLPVRGRSGGGLFNARGELVGVCSAADKEENRGIYVGLRAIHNILDRSDLASLYREDAGAIASIEEPKPRFGESIEPVGFGDEPTGQPSADDFLAQGNGPDDSFGSGDSNPFTGGMSFAGGMNERPRDAFNSQPPAGGGFSTNEGYGAGGYGAQPNGRSAQAGGVAPNAGANSDVEIVCIIRSKSNPQMGSRVIVIDQSDPRLIELLRDYERKAQTAQ